MAWEILWKMFGKSLGKSLGNSGNIREIKPYKRLIKRVTPYSK